MLSRRPLPPALGHQALLRVRLAPPHVLWAGRRCGDSSLPAAGPSRTQCPLQHPCSTPAPSPRVSGLQVLGSSTSILKAKVEAKFASSQGCPQGPGLFVENPVPEAQPTCALGCDARRPGRSNRRRACGGAGPRSVGLEALGHGAGSWKRKGRAGAPGSWAVPLLGGRASRCWLFWKPARVARHMGWLPGARVPGDLLVTSFWDIRLLAAPALFPWARAQGSCPGLPWGPPGGWLRLLHQTSKGLSFPASPPTAPGGHGGQAVGGH